MPDQLAMPATRSTLNGREATLAKDRQKEDESEQWMLDRLLNHLRRLLYAPAIELRIVIDR